jgi:hypothetical protein
MYTSATLLVSLRVYTNNMIWSMKPTEVADAHARFSKAGLLRRPPERLIEAFSKTGSMDVSAIEYLIIPPQASHNIGKLVLPYVTLDESGFLVADTPHAYAVTNTPDINAIKSPVARERVQALHAIAEERALRNGIFTPHGRAIAEIAIVECTAPAYRQAYITDRCAHIGALIIEVEDLNRPTLLADERAIVTQNLNQAVETLRAYSS